MTPKPENMNSNDNDRGEQHTGDSDVRTPTNEARNTPSQAMNFITLHKIDLLMWVLRLINIVSGFLFLIPIQGKQYAWYQRVLLCNGAISALKLHTRSPRFQASREFLGTILAEDSCHYLIYSLIFLYFSSQITLAIVPPVLYAFLHALLFTGQMLDALSIQAAPLRNLMSQVTSHQVLMLRLIACTEIFLMPAIIAGIFAGKGNLFVPFMYYRFLTFRYASRRNPYCRIMFSEIRVSIQELCNHPRCPLFVKGLLYRIITFVSRLAPPVITS